MGIIKDAKINSEKRSRGAECGGGFLLYPGLRALDLS